MAEDFSTVAGADLVRDRWPLHGPYTPELTTDAVAAVAALLRYLNYATGQGCADALRYASHGYQVTGTLAATAYGQDQLLTQLARWADRLGTDPTLCHAQDRHDAELARQTASRAADALRQARTLANRLGDALVAVQNQLTWLSHDLPEGGEA